MGSYLTIVNNTPDTWQCKVGPDTKALKISAIVAGVITATLASLTIGRYVTAGSWQGKASAVGAFYLFVPASALVTTGLVVGAAVQKKLQDSGYDTILAGESHRYGKMSLSLWRQSVCTKTTPDGQNVRIDTVYMRPIFSGATIDSNKDYDIQSWINKNGVTTYTVEGKNETTEGSNGTMPVPVVLNNGTTGAHNATTGGNNGTVVPVPVVINPGTTGGNVETMPEVVHDETTEGTNEAKQQERKKETTEYGTIHSNEATQGPTQTYQSNKETTEYGTIHPNEATQGPTQTYQSNIHQ